MCGCIDVDHFVIIKEYISMNIYKWQSIKTLLLRKSVLRCCKVEFALFLSRFSLTNIHDSQNSRGRVVYLFMTCLICLVSVMISVLNCEEFMGRLRIALVFAILTIAPLILESLQGNARITMETLQKCLSP